MHIDKALYEMCIFIGKIPWRREWLCIPIFLGFLGGSDGKESSCNAGDLGSIPGWEDPLENGIATHSSTLDWRIPMDRGAWWATIHGIAESDTTERLSIAQPFH